MKPILILSFLVLAAPTMALAQENKPDQNIIRVAPLGFINKVRLHYERVLSQKVSVGLIGTGYYGLYSGIKAEPCMRIYLSEKGAPRGFYLQGKMSYGNYSADLCHDFDAGSDDGDWDWDDRQASPNAKLATDLDDDCEVVSFSTIGADLGIGAQGFIGKKKRTAIDFCISLQYNPLPDSFLDKTNKTGFRDDWKYAWYFVHAGAVVAPMLSIGRSF